MRIPEVKSNTVDTINMNTLLRFRNLWYFVDRAFQVPRDIILAPRAIGIFTAAFFLSNLKSLITDKMSDQTPKSVEQHCLVVQYQFYLTIPAHSTS